MNNQLLGITKNGYNVYFTEESSHAKTHFAHHPKLLRAVKNALPEITAGEASVRVQMDTGEIVGTRDLIETVPEDTIVYALREKRTTYSRFVKNKQPVNSSQIVIDIRKSSPSSKNYYLYTAYVGILTPSFPGGDYLPEQSLKFWSNHALIWGTQEVIPETITSHCPW